MAQLSGYVSEHSAYHHGEQSLQTTIVGMAQNFVGSNNINLLVPQGAPAAVCSFSAVVSSDFLFCCKVSSLLCGPCTGKPNIRPG